MNQDDGGPAFPALRHSEVYDNRDGGKNVEHETVGGMSLLAYFMAHAPAEPQTWFEPVMATAKLPRRAMTDSVRNLARAAWDREADKQRYLQWPMAWAEAQLAQLKARP